MLQLVATGHVIVRGKSQNIAGMFCGRAWLANHTLVCHNTPTQNNATRYDPKQHNTNLPIPTQSNTSQPNTSQHNTTQPNQPNQSSGTTTPSPRRVHHTAPTVPQSPAATLNFSGRPGCSETPARTQALRELSKYRRSITQVTSMWLKLPRAFRAKKKKKND